MADRRKVPLVTTSSSRAKQQLRNLAPKGPMLIAKGLDMGSQAGSCLISVTKKELEEVDKKTGARGSLSNRQERLFTLSQT